MSVDLTLACLLITLGAMVGYAADEYFAFTKRVAAWIDRVLDPG